MEKVSLLAEHWLFERISARAQSLAVAAVCSETLPPAENSEGVKPARVSGTGFR